MIVHEAIKIYIVQEYLMMWIYAYSIEWEKQFQKYVWWWFIGNVVSNSFVTPWTVACQAPLWDSPVKKTGMGSHSLLQGIFLTQGSNHGLLHCRQILYHLTT